MEVDAVVSTGCASGLLLDASDLHPDHCAICKGVSHTGAKDERVDCACRGVLPAVSGQFVSHGLRTFAFEGSLTGLKALSGGAAELQVGLPDTCVNISA